MFEFEPELTENLARELTARGVAELPDMDDEQKRQIMSSLTNHKLKDINLELAKIFGDIFFDEVFFTRDPFLLTKAGLRMTKTYLND